MELCLDCRACETACPSGVQYGRLIEPFRVAMEQAGEGPKKTNDWFHRWILFRLFPYPKRLRRALLPARIAQRVGLMRLFEGLGVVRLLPVRERAKQLFGEEGASAVVRRFEAEKKPDPQGMLDFMAQQAAAVPEVKGRGRRKKKADASPDELKARREATTLDRIHAAMLLQSSGATNALRAMLEAETQRGPDFLRLANALSALYPRDSEEKRLLDAMLLAVPR